MFQPESLNTFLQRLGRGLRQFVRDAIYHPERRYMRGRPRLDAD